MKHTIVDTVLTEINLFLISLSEPGSESGSESGKSKEARTISSPSSNSGPSSAGFMRINHAGEVMAQGLYRGARLTINDETLADSFEQASEEEYEHLSLCATRLAELNTHKSVATPLSYIVAFGMGAASGLFGKQYALGFIAETENQVASHLEDHLLRLDERDEASRKIITKILEDEREHERWATNAGATSLPNGVATAMKFASGVWKKVVEKI